MWLSEFRTGKEIIFESKSEQRKNKIGLVQLGKRDRLIKQ